MRDPDRIDAFLAELGHVWKKYPDLRFGQLVMNLTRNRQGNFQDPFYWEEDEWLHRLEWYGRAVNGGEGE